MLVYGRARYREVGKKRGKLRRPENEHVVANDAAPAIVPVPLWEAARAKHGSRRFASGRPGIGPTCCPGSSSAVTAVSASKANGSREDRSRRTTSAGAQSQAAGPSAPRPRSRRPISRTPWSTASRSGSTSAPPDFREIRPAPSASKATALLIPWVPGTPLALGGGATLTFAPVQSGNHYGNADDVLGRDRRPASRRASWRCAGSG